MSGFGIHAQVRESIRSTDGNIMKCVNVLSHVLWRVTERIRRRVVGFEGFNTHSSSLPRKTSGAQCSCAFASLVSDLM